MRAPSLGGVAGTTGRVLVVDDNKVIRQLIRVNLELEGFEVVTASDGVECLDIVHEVRPDVITLDVVMPRLDGLRTAARLRADPRTRDVPLAVVSACNAGEVDRGTDAGVDLFLAKPFEPDSLVRAVWELMERRHRQPLRVAAEPVQDSGEESGQGTSEPAEGGTASGARPGQEDLRERGDAPAGPDRPATPRSRDTGESPGPAGDGES